MTRDQKIVWGIVAMCSIAVFFIWTPLVSHSQGVLTVSFLDVGQGDAIFIESPSGKQVLIDGGPDRSVLRELGEVMSWNDRIIDVVVATHPDQDHIGGLLDVLDRYKVDYIFEPGVEHGSPVASAFSERVTQEGAEHVYARRGQEIDLGDGALVEILFPDRDVSGLETNTASIIARLTYGETSFLLTGDSPRAIEKYLVRIDGEKLASTVLKAGHHGSNTSTDKTFLDLVGPEYGVFSRGCDNRYGHPHVDVVTLFINADIPTLDTCEIGRITFVSDGAKVSLK
jgi:competence protein ComEC